MKKVNKKIIAVILSVAIVLSSANWNAFAITPKDYTDNASTPAPAQVQNVSSSESSAEESSQAAPESSVSEQPSEQSSEPIPQPEPTEASVSVAVAEPAVQMADAYVASVTFDGTTTNYSSFEEAWTAANNQSTSEINRATVQLLADIEESPTSTYEVAVGKYIMLDLNNHTLTGNGSTSVITVRGGFELEDSSTTKDGKITGGKATYYGGGVYVDRGTFIMNSGSITGNRATVGGGVFVDGTFTMSGGSIEGNQVTNGNGGGVYTNGTFEMSGGSITGNKASYYGGGVRVDGTFNMSGGSITDNRVPYDGGGVYTNGTFEMSGGSITGNTAKRYGGGVFVGDYGKSTMSGNVNITDNTKDGNANNVYLSTGKKINIAGSLDVQSRIGVTMQTPGVFTSGLGGNADAFTSDDASYNVFPDATTKEAYLSTDSPKAHIQHSTISGNTKTFQDAWTIANGASSSESDRVTVQLLADIAESPEATYEVASGKYITLDLNNHTLTGNESKEDQSVIKVSGDFQFEDTSDTKGGKITGGNANNGGGVYVDGGTFNMSGGSITENTASERGGGVYVGGSYGKFTMEGGSITDNTAVNGGGGGVYVVSSGTFEMTGGSITGNTANFGGGVAVSGGGGFLMTGGSITENTASERGGGVYVGGSYGKFTMEGGSITDNTFTSFSVNNGYGGGVYVDGSGIFTMNGGSVTDNTNSRCIGYGGGVYVDGTFTMRGGSITGNTNSISGCYSGYGGGVYVGNSGTFTMDRGSIKGNTATSGGGVYVDGTFTMSAGSIEGNQVTNGSGGGVYTNGTFEMSGGSITGNTAVHYGGGVYVNTYGTFTMSGGSITGNTARHSNGGGVYVCSSVRFHLQGNVNISGNTNDSTANNVYLTKDSMKILIDGELNTNSRIGITMKTPGVFTSGLGGNIYAFISDDASYSVFRNADKEACLSTELKAHVQQGSTISFNTASFLDAWTIANAASTSERNCVTVQLLADIAESPESTYEVASGKYITLDLNGHTLKGNGSTSVITVNGNFQLEDSGSEGRITGGKATYGGGVYVNGTFEMSGGSITGNTEVHHGGGVYVGNGGTFTMSGGSITDNTTSSYGGGGVYVSSGTFTMSGGSITENTADDNGGGVLVDEGRFTMSGGSITDNTADLEGGGVYVDSGTFTMSGGSITGNNARNGGGVYVDSGTFTMSGGSIAKNTANNDSGGVGVGHGTFTMTDGSITDNTAKYGGGVYVYGLFAMPFARFTMTGGSIAKNNAVDGGGVYVSEFAVFTMIGGSIAKNNAVDGGGVYVGDSIAFAVASGKFIMEGGSIEGNQVTNGGSGGGVFVDGNGTVHLQGNVNITGNTKDGTENNLYLPGSTKINITYTLDLASRIGIYMSAPGVFTSGLSGRGSADNFTSDDENYSVGEIEGEAALGHIATINVQKDGVFGTKEEPVPGGGGESGEPSGEGETFTPAQAGSDAASATPATGDALDISVALIAAAGLAIGVGAFSKRRRKK